MERYRWLIESLFDGGVYPSLACYARGHDALRYHRVVAKTKGLGAGWGFQGIFPLLRERGFRALSIGEPPPRTQLAAALHLVRDDGGDDAHRALADDSTLERAFLDAGYATFDRCCDWNAPAASRAAVVAVAHADVIVGMHGAAMTHSPGPKINQYAIAQTQLQRHRRVDGVGLDAVGFAQAPYIRKTTRRLRRTLLRDAHQFTERRRPVVFCSLHEGILRQDIPRPRTTRTALDARRRAGRPDCSLRERGVRRPAREEAVLRQITHY